MRSSHEEDAGRSRISLIASDLTLRRRAFAVGMVGNLMSELRLASDLLGYIQGNPPGKWREMGSVARPGKLGWGRYLLLLARLRTAIARLIW